MKRRHFLAAPLAASALSAAGPSSGYRNSKAEGAVPEYEKPLFNLHQFSKTPIKVQSIELLRNGKNYFVRATSTDGVVGLARTKSPIEEYTSMVLKVVIPFFIGKDVRDLETLIDSIYLKNYKMAGQPFWAPVAYVEQALFDIFGKTVNKPLYDLFGGAVRKQIPVYLSGGIRETTAEEEVEVYRDGLAKTGAKAMKFKIAGRMSHNIDAMPQRTEKMVRLARKTYGDNVVIYVDANGCYTAPKAIEVGKFLEDMKCGFFEEPCPWEEFTETKRVADALKIPIAFGECDTSLWMFQWLIENRAIDIVQPDINYNGGFIRAARVARMARQAGITIVPHNTQTSASAVNILHFAASTPNIGPYMEFPFRGKNETESWFTPQFVIKDGFIGIPTGPGLGVEVDPTYLAKARKVELG